MKNPETEFLKSKYSLLSEIGARLNLSFSSQLILGNKIIALDGKKKSLLILETGQGLTEPCIINLNNVAAITTRKSYGSIQQGDLRYKNFEEFLERVDLKFKFKDSEETIAIPFYDSDVHTESDKLKSVRNAKNWQMILSKLLGLQTGKARINCH